MTNDALNMALPAGSGECPSVAHPWRRYFARMINLSVYLLLIQTFSLFVMHETIVPRGAIRTLIESFIAMVIMLFIEPLLLKLFGTTAGKAIFGLRVEPPGGGRLTYGEGFRRTWCVIGRGMGYSIPIYSLVRMWKCRNAWTLN